MANQKEPGSRELQEREYKPNLINAMETGNRLEIAVILKQYKLPTGAANFPALLQIPASERLPALAHRDLPKAVSIVVVGLQMALEGINLTRPMNDTQVMNLAEAVVDTAAEDNLSLEDLMLFLQKMVRGEYKGFYEGMDIVKFMEKFEVYRQERYEALQEFKENQHLVYKSLGDPTRSKSTDPIDEHLSAYSTKLSNMKDELREQKEINKRK